ncbi:ABC transporter substrate-binding protein [Chloroflexota bacterium]
MVTEKEVVMEKEVVAEEGPEMVQNAVGNLVEKPQYGGVLNTADAVGPRWGFSNSSRLRGYPFWWWRMTNENLAEPDGSGEYEGISGEFASYDIMTGNLAESWEVIEPDTLIFHIRQGVRWHDKPPTNGMELTSDDVVYTFVLTWGREGAMAPRTYPLLSNLKNPEESIYVHPDDPWAVVFKSVPGKLPALWEFVSNLNYIVPEALGPMEEEGFVDWWGVVGTGPIILTDYVSGSSLTWERNTNYWKNDPLHPENQLPYLDGLKTFIMADLSTQQAALRTGKLDILTKVEVEDAESISRSSPELQWRRSWGTWYGLYMRNDVAPFDDVNVRRAMMMAIDHEEITQAYYGGEAEKFWWPAYPIPEHASMYVPLEEMPEAVQELYGCHPDKAEQLLDAAGLPGPNRFTTSVIANLEEDIDLLSVVKEYWSRVGVTLEIRVKETAVQRSMATAKTYEHGYIASVSVGGQINKMQHTVPGGLSNYAMVDDPLVEKWVADISKLYFDPAAKARFVKEASPELINRAYHIRLPAPITYNAWQPWLGGYHGETSPSYMAGVTKASEYVWIDQDLKEEMTGKR